MLLREYNDISLCDHFMTYTIYSKIAHKTRTKKLCLETTNVLTLTPLGTLCRKTTVYLNTSWSADQFVDKWNNFKDAFIDISNNCAPMETRRLKHRNNPWINSQIIELIYKRDYLKRKAIKNKNQETWLLYRRARNNVTEMIKNAQKDNILKTAYTKVDTIRLKCGKC